MIVMVDINACYDGFQCLATQYNKHCYLITFTLSENIHGCLLTFPCVFLLLYIPLVHLFHPQSPYLSKVQEKGWKEVIVINMLYGHILD